MFVDPPVSASTPLTLELIHPLDARQDRRLALVPHGAGWHGTTAPWAERRWGLRLVAAHAGWRLTGELPANGAGARLRPAVRP